VELLSVRAGGWVVVVPFVALACTSLNMGPPDGGSAGSAGAGGGPVGAGGGTAGGGGSGVAGTGAPGAAGTGGGPGAAGTGGPGTAGTGVAGRGGTGVAGRGGTGGGAAGASAGTGGGGTGGTIVEPPGIIAYWRFNEGTGMTVADSSDNGQPLTLSSNNRWTAGHEGGCLTYDGVNDVAEIVPQSGQQLFLYPTVPVTLAAWVKPDPAAASRPFTTVVAREHEDFLFQDFWMGLVNGRPSCTIHSSSKQGPTASAVAPTTAWTHIACTYGLDGVARLYVNSLQVDTMSTNQNLGPIPTAILVGASRTDADGLHDFFSGLIDEVRIYNRTLTSTEVAAIAR
jgi:concanavalin A-like lectin/glucanase superfamily protein